MITPEQIEQMIVQNAAFHVRCREVGTLVATLEAMLAVATEHMRGQLVDIDGDLHYVGPDLRLVKITQRDSLNAFTCAGGAA